MFFFFCYSCILQLGKDPPSNSVPSAEDAEIPGDETFTGTLKNTEPNSPLERHAKTPQSKRQQSEVLTTAHLHFKDEEQLSSKELLEEENIKNNAKELSN